jgi:branched-chain amino acid aminotransferase
MKKLAEYIWFNGEFVQWDSAVVHVLTHSLNYSGAVFEGERAYGGKVFKLPEHTERLMYSAKVMGLDVNYSSEEIMLATEQLLSKNNIQDAYVRPLIWRGSEVVKMFSDTLTTNIMIATIPSKPDFRNDLKINIGKWRKPDPRSLDPQSKSAAHYANSISMLKEAAALGYDDSLLLDLEDYVAECCVTNIFFAKDRELHTPSADRFLNGITRQAVIEIAGKLGIKIVERRIKLDEIDQFDNCFLTGTANEIAGISLVNRGDKVINYANSMVGELQHEFAKMVGKYWAL